MCGIAGFVSSQQLSPAAAKLVLERMTSVIAHRGPDGHGYWLDSHAALGHRRLAIVDLAGGHQPMTNEDSSLWISYNGEVFNHASLRPKLEAAGHHFANRSDTETLLHAFEEYGPRSVDQFRGMFAYVIWNTKTKSLFAVRDRLGIKPFYYYWDGSTFVFASEIKALLEHPAVPCRPNSVALAEYLVFGYLSGQETMFENIFALPPGNWLRLDLGSSRPALEIQPYWDVPVSVHDSSISYEEASTELARLIEESVKLRLMSDVPLGIFLSGGVDSSTIAALVRKLAPGKVKSFCVGYQESDYSELAFARQTSSAIGTEHHEVVVSSRDFFDALPKLVWHEDEPITWPSSVPLYFVSKRAKQEVTVVLTGEGADELFGGYQRYRHYLNFLRQWETYRYVPAFLRSIIRASIASVPGIPPDLRRKLGHTIAGRDCSLKNLYLENFYGAFETSELDRLLPGYKDPFKAFRDYFDSRPQASMLERMLFADQKTYLVELLRKQDRMSMATGIESRVPFLDHQLLAFASSLPDSFKLAANGQNKSILKHAVENLIPGEVIHRKKMGFPTPIKGWLRRDFRNPVHELLKAKNSFTAQYLNHKYVEILLSRSDQEDTTDRVWRLLTLELWGRHFFLNRPVERI